MKKASIWVSGLALVFGLAPSAALAQSADPSKVVYDAKTALEYFKGLSGEWVSGTAAHDHGEGRNAPTALTFKTKAAGSAVV